MKAHRDSFLFAVRDDVMLDGRSTCIFRWCMQHGIMACLYSGRSLEIRLSTPWDRSHYSAEHNCCAVEMRPSFPLERTRAL